MLIQILVIFHVMAAMLWFGGSITLPRRARAALQSEISEARRQLQGIAREGKTLSISGLVTFLTGLSMVFAMGGFGAVAMRFHISLLLTLVWLVLGAVFGRKTIGQLVAASEGEVMAEGAPGLAARLGKIIGVQHALFTTITVLMLWHIR